MTLSVADLILFGIGAWMLMDGLVFGLMPDMMRRMTAFLDGAEDSDIIQAGMLAALLGAAIVFVSLRF